MVFVTTVYYGIRNEKACDDGGRGLKMIQNCVWRHLWRTPYQRSVASEETVIFSHFMGTDHYLGNISSYIFLFGEKLCKIWNHHYLKGYFNNIFLDDWEFIFETCSINIINNNEEEGGTLLSFFLLKAKLCKKSRIESYYR